MGTLHGRLAPWSSQDLERIHQAGLKVLEETGVQVESEGILDLLEATDAAVDKHTHVVRFPAGMVQERMSNCPGCWDLAPLVPGEFSVTADCGSNKVWDWDTRGPRPVTPRDLVDAARLAQALTNIDGAGCLVESMIGTLQRSWTGRGRNWVVHRMPGRPRRQTTLTVLD